MRITAFVNCKSLLTATTSETGARGAIIRPQVRGLVPMNAPPACKHPRVKLIAQDEYEKYVECLECGAILEAGEIEEPPTGFDESLGDA